jgi:type II secretory pathway predicted ATPase ExeA/DNA-binding XRE family transcriptional regulator
MAKRPIRLKERLREAGIKQAELAREVELSRPLINAVCERGYIPPSIEDFKERIEAALKKWKIAVAGIWQIDQGAEIGRLRMPRQGRNFRSQISDGRFNNGAKKNTAKEVKREMNFTKDFLTEEEIRHFVLNGDPFFDLDDHSEIYKSPQLKVVERKFLEVIKRHGIMAIVGEVGSGKSTLLRHIIGRLMKDRSTRMIMPDSIDRERLNGTNITQAVISQMGCERVPRFAVERDKLAKKMLEESVRTGADPVLVIDEAHDLKPQAIIALKRLWDSGLIFKLLSVIIIGQGGEDSRGAWGLKGSLLFHSQLKEFAERCYLVDLGVMNGSMGDYLEWRFSRAGGKVRKIFTDDALKMLVKKAPQPQVANNVAMRAMKLAFRDGALQVTKEHVADVMNQFEV